MKKIADTVPAIEPDYRQFIEELKARITVARVTAARRVNRELITLYWDIGRAIVDKQKTLGWGESVVDMVAVELKRSFPGISGFSPRNVRDMKRLYLTYHDGSFWRQVVAKFARQVGECESSRQRGRAWSEDSTRDFLRQLVTEVPWGQNLLILNKLAEPAERLFYLRAVAQFGWSRNVLLNQIKAGAYERAAVAKKTHNFPLALPDHLAEQADEMMKSSYNLEFLDIRRPVRERELEDRLIARLQTFLLELGYGFCFVGRQHRLTVGSKEYVIDLLFYHRFLKALVAFELKVGPFEPEFAGKMDFYLNLLNDKERGPEDQPSIGIILCAEKDDVEVEYALRTKANPIGVAVYELQSKLPGPLKGKLPTAKQLAAAIREELESGK
ncbi:MAG TPA: PDDEXK nuclease domain-containing protein [Candidatus Ozemobacteraceae bacterium]|nr:PDDEXK nuclease domain-containing protein [Candidatus Ozemobacteraceae bacterium]